MFHALIHWCESVSDSFKPTRFDNNMNLDSSKFVAFGNISFDGDSLPEFSEFDSDSVIEGYHHER